MSRFTLYRADIDSPRLARALGKVPGVEVGGDDETGETSGVANETAPPMAPNESEPDDGGLREKVPVPETDIVDEETASVVKTYGLLGLGVSMVMLGIATVGIWVYLRRRGNGESETPPPTTGLDTGERTVTEPSAFETDGEPTTPSPSVVAPDEEPAAEAAEGPASEVDEEMESGAATDEEPHGRAEGDRTDVEWETRDTAPAPEPETAEQPDELAESETTEDETRPTESVDAAPLLGVAFLAVTGAVVKWLQGDTEGPTA